MRILFLLSLILLGPSYVLPQAQCTSSIEGVVSDYHSKSKLENATIEVLGQKLKANSDKQGFFRLGGLCNREYQLSIAHEDCTTTFITVTVDGKTTIEVKLEHHLEELEEVQVIGKAQKKSNTGQEVTLNNELIEQYSGASLGDALREISGVSSLNTGATIVKPVIHGLNGSRVLLLNNGVRMQDMEWGDEHAPNVDINSAQTISVIKGANALLYGGDAIGGVILLNQSPMRKNDSLYGKTILGAMSNGRGGNISSELTKTYENGWFAKGQVSYKRLGDQQTPDYILSNTGMEEIGATVTFGKQMFTWGWDAQYSFHKAEIAILRASHIGNIDDLIRSINSGQPEVIEPFTYALNNPRQQVTHHLAKLKLYRRFEGLGKWNLQYDFQSNQRFEYDVRRGENSERASLDLELTTHTLTTDFKWDANSQYQVQVGALGRYQNNFANPATGVRRLIPDYEKYDLGLFAIANYNITDQWLLDGGIRYDFTQIDAQKFYQTSRWEERGYDQEFEDIVIQDLGSQLLTNPVFNYNNMSATFGFEYKKNNDDNLRFNYALSKRAPNPSELFSDGLHHSAARIELGDLRVTSETSNKISLSKERNFKFWGFTIEPYANFIENFILLEPSGLEFTIRGAFPVWEYRQTNARLLGVDTNLYVDWSTHWATTHQFSLVKGTDTENDIALINIPAANFQNKIRYTNKEWNNFEVSLQSQLVLEQNEFPENITVFSPEQQQEVLLEINSPPEAYHIVTLNSKAVFEMGQQLKLTTGLVISNLLDTNYRDYLNRQRFFADDLGRNIILQLKLNY